MAPWRNITGVFSTLILVDCILWLKLDVWAVNSTDIHSALGILTTVRDPSTENPQSRTRSVHRGPQKRYVICALGTLGATHHLTAVNGIQDINSKAIP